MKSKILLISVAIAMVLALTASQTEAARVYGTLSNFDLVNFTAQDVNDLDVILYGAGLSCAWISDYYAGWGTVWNGTQHVPRGGCTDLGGGRIRITWFDPANPIPNIPPGNKVHFGVRFKSGAPDVKVEYAIWTFNGAPVAAISFITQTWVGYADCRVGDIIWPPDSIPRSPDPGPPWAIERRWAWTPEVIPLDSLTQTNPLVVSLNWSIPVVETLTTEPLEMQTTPLPQQGGVLFQYSVTSGSDLLAVFTNEAELERTEAIPTLTEWGLIIFVVLLAGWMAFVVIRRWRASHAAA